MLTSDEASGLRQQARDFLAGHDPSAMPRLEFLRARFDAGLAWVHYPAGLGGQGLSRSLQAAVDAEFAAAGAPDNNPGRIGIGLGMAAPTILAFGTEEQKQRWLRPLWTGEEVWCQLFSEPGAGSDRAGLATRAVRVKGDREGGTGRRAEGGGQSWRVSGQKVWTSIAHAARWGLLLARTDPDVPKHAGLTYFGLDMTGPGVEVRPLRQLTGEAEFNEVFLTDAAVADADRIGGIGEGWRVAQATLMNERVAIGGGALPREGGMAGLAARAWREHPEARTPGLLTVSGRNGHLRLDAPFHRAPTVTLALAGEAPRTIPTPYLGNGYVHEAIEAQRCWAEGLVESPAMTHDQTLHLMGVLDEIRQQVGVRYPGD